MLMKCKLEFLEKLVAAKKRWDIVTIKKSYRNHSILPQNEFWGQVLTQASASPFGI